MEIQIEFPLNTAVHCQGELLGETIELVIDPGDNQITHLVVKEKYQPYIERLVPIRYIEGIFSSKVNLCCTKDEFSEMDIFCEKGMVMQSHNNPVSDMKNGVYQFPVTRSVLIESRSVPDGMISMDENTVINATDGRIGYLDKLGVSPHSQCITHLIVRNSAVFGPRTVYIPISAIQSFNAHKIQLHISKKELKLLADEYTFA